MWAMSTYRNVGIPLTPAVFAELLLELVEPGRPHARADLARLVGDEHAKRGGLPARGDVSTTAKKALSELQRRGLAEQIGSTRGYWRVVEKVAPADSGPLEFGDGPESVYVYYFPAYRDQAALLGHNEWPMKIGMTKTAVTPRLRDQCGTAMPEEPVLAMVYRTEDASNAERLLHSTLIARDRRIKGAPGKEWFQTSLTEIKAILDFTNGEGARSAVQHTAT